MAHHQFMAQFCYFPIKCAYNYFLQFYSINFNAFLNHRLMAHFQWQQFVTILSQLRNLSPFCYNFIMRRQKIYRDNKLNRAIGEYNNGTKKVISVTELRNVCLNSMKDSFKMILDACEFDVPALYQLVKNLVFC